MAKKLFIVLSLLVGLLLGMGTLTSHAAPLAQATPTPTYTPIPGMTYTDWVSGSLTITGTGGTFFASSFTYGWSGYQGQLVYNFADEFHEQSDEHVYFSPINADLKAEICFKPSNQFLYTWVDGSARRVPFANNLDYGMGYSPSRNGWYCHLSDGTEFGAGYWPGYGFDFTGYTPTTGTYTIQMCFSGAYLLETYDFVGDIYYPLTGTYYSTHQECSLDYTPEPTATPTPGASSTPSPTANTFATAQPWATLACVAPTARPSGTPFKTSTPFGPTHTPTIPGATNTPGGPTATATPTTTQTYTGTVTNFTLGPVEFGQNLNPWGAAIGPNWGVSGTSWLTNTGWDNLPGVASLPWVDASTNAATYTGTTLFKDALVYIKCNGQTFCTPLPARALRLTGMAQNDRFIIGDSLALHVYLLDLNYAGYRQQAWFKADTISIGTDAEWRAFTKVINFDYGLSREIGGIALVAAYTQGGVGPHPPLPQGYLRLDHLLLAVGSTADYVNGNLPVCAVGNGTTAIKTKVCTIQRTKTDVMAACGEIGGITEIGNALNVFRCRVETYFLFNNYNRQQLLDMRDRQSYNEPIGTFNDIGKVIAQFQQLLTELSYINTPTYYTPFDFAQSMSGGAMDDFFTRGPQLRVITENDGFTDYLNSCPQVILDWSSTASRGSCFVVAMLRGTPVVSAMQWLLNALFLLFLLAFAWRTITRLANA